MLWQNDANFEKPSIEREAPSGKGTWRRWAGLNSKKSEGINCDSVRSKPRIRCISAHVRGTEARIFVDQARRGHAMHMYRTCRVRRGRNMDWSCCVYPRRRVLASPQRRRIIKRRRRRRRRRAGSHRLRIRLRRRPSQKKKTNTKTSSPPRHPHTTVATSSVTTHGYGGL